MVIPFNVGIVMVATAIPQSPRLAVMEINQMIVRIPNSFGELVIRQAEINRLESIIEDEPIFIYLETGLDNYEDAINSLKYRRDVEVWELNKTKILIRKLTGFIRHSEILNLEKTKLKKLKKDVIPYAAARM